VLVSNVRTETNSSITILVSRNPMGISANEMCECQTSVFDGLLGEEWNAEEKTKRVQ
jgi:hypothetical protein